MQQSGAFRHHRIPSIYKTPIVHRITIAIVVLLIAPAVVYADASASPMCSACAPRDSSLDRIYVVSTRSLAYDACCAQLDHPALQVMRSDGCGTLNRASLTELLDDRSADRPVLIQIHGNRMTQEAALERGLFVYRHTVPHCDPRPLDYIIFSWPSDREGMLVNDGREKAERTDAQGLYLSWLLREFAQRQVPMAMIGFSFGGRIATGATHALAGGALGGRVLPQPHLHGADVSLGLIAPALEDDWLRAGHYHGMSSLNTKNMTILYNRRDAVLKRYWLIDQVRGNRALGYTGPRSIAPRLDGTPMPVAAHDCSLTLGIRHDEKKYYLEECRAGVKMAKLLQTTY